MVLQTDCTHATCGASYAAPIFVCMYVCICVCSYIFCACLRPYIFLLLVLYTNLRRLKLIIYHISWQLKHYFYIKTTHCLIYYTDSTQLFWQNTLTIFHNTSKLYYFHRAYFIFVILFYIFWFFTYCNFEYLFKYRYFRWLQLDSNTMKRDMANLNFFYFFEVDCIS